MVYSSDVVAGDTALASEYNNLRKDTINTTLGHDHDGTNSKFLTVINTTTRYYNMNASAFNPVTGTTESEYTQADRFLAPTVTSAIGFFAPVHLPHEATITAVKLIAYRDDAASSIDIQLTRVNLSDGGSSSDLTSITANWTSGASSLENSGLSIVIDNSLYSYAIRLTIDANDSANDCYYICALITYTITKPLP